MTPNKKHIMQQERQESRESAKKFAEQKKEALSKYNCFQKEFPLANII